MEPCSTPADYPLIIYKLPGGPNLALGPARDGQPATHANGGTVGFAAASPELADKWHAAGLANGGVSIENPPGVREGAAGKLYLAYLRDPDGNKICALHRMPKA